MGMNYTLVNINANTASAVLVKNLLDSKPTSPCTTSATTPEPTSEPAPTAVPNFVYTPWQLLNPSFGAEEMFTYNDVLSVVIKKSSSSGTIQSKHTQVYPGSSYMVVIGENDIQVVNDRPNGTGYVEVTTPTPSVDPYSLDIEWYLSSLNVADGSKIGITRNIGADTSAFFQLDNGTLLFMPVSDNKQTQTYAPDKVSAATAYQPPSYATGIKVTLQADEAGKFNYTFDQPNALEPG
ncbi:hypothetical protein [Sulfuriflexus mobilis]|uniref:hypothetical protein n=1 Tax=Sulfuriflexus mobilis TaxID=1811807 RepID=UPI000F84602A|nr:hypothetical protein [Sulfuriflexus mobilis]